MWRIILAVAARHPFITSIPAVDAFSSLGAERASPAAKVLFVQKRVGPWRLVFSLPMLRPKQMFALSSACDVAGVMGVASAASAA